MPLSKEAPMWNPPEKLDPRVESQPSRIEKGSTVVTGTITGTGHTLSSV
jgi:hypothetical protein